MNISIMQPLETRRLLNAGQLDTSFGVNGVLTVPSDGVHIVGESLRSQEKIPFVNSLPAGFQPASAAFVEPSGNVLVVLIDNKVLRLHPDGTLDASFGEAGVASPSSNDLPFYPRDFALAPDGRCAVLIGSSGFETTYQVLMFTPDGKPDTAFDDDGVLEISPRDAEAFEIGGNALAFQSDGTLIVAATEVAPSSDADPYYTFTLDRFDRSGTVTVVETQTSAPRDVVIGPDDRIYTLNAFEDNSLFFFSVSRFFPDGKLDTTFQNQVNQLSVANMAVQADGRVLVSGLATQTENETRYVVARYTSDGSPDPTFGSRHGVSVISTIPVAPGQFPSVGLHPQSDGTILLAHALDESTQPLVNAVTKLQGDPTIRVNSTGIMLVGGTGGDDVIRIYRRSRDGAVVARVNNVARAFASKKIKHIVVLSHGGDDNITVGNHVRGAYLDGGDGNDTLSGGANGDILIGGAGKDRLLGNDGNDTLVGGAGNDLLIAGAGNDRLFGNGGIDTLHANGGNDRLFGNAAADLLVGGAGNDSADYDAEDSRDEIEMLLTL